MSDREPGTSLPRAQSKRSRWSILLVAIPLAALIIVGYLGVQALAHRGTLITVTFDRAADVRPGDTKVLYEGAEAGELVKIKPNKNGRDVDFELRMASEVRDSSLTTTAQFWLIGASPSISDLSSLKAAVSGVAIGYQPGEGGERTTHFKGLNKEPVVTPRDKGKYIYLDTRSLGAIGERSEVLYHDQSVGKITDIDMIDENHFRLKAFIFSPYDALVKPHSVFWRQSPLRISLSSGALRADLAPSSTILTGGIEMDTQSGLAGVPNTGSEFTLYASESAARQRLIGPSVRYEFVFTGDTGGLPRDAAINLMSFQIGEVESSKLSYDPKSGAPQTIVSGLIYPANLALGDAAVEASGDLRARADQAIDKLLMLGYRAKLVQTPPFVGSPGIALAPVPNIKAEMLDNKGPVPRIPTAGRGAQFDAIFAHVEQILAKVNRVPIESIGQDLKQVTAKLSQLANAPDTREMLEHLKDASAKLDQVMATVQPQVGPLMNDLTKATGQLSGDGGGAGLQDMMSQLTEAARALRSLSDYLERHPEALIRGNPQDK